MPKSRLGSKKSSRSTNNKPASIKRKCLTLAIAQSLLLGAAGAQSATITVTSALDNGTDCTLREAIANANDNTTGDLSNGCTAGTPNGTDDIVFDNSLSGSTITLGGSELQIITDLNIDGDINNDNSPDITISGNNQSRVIQTDNGATVNLEGLTISNGVSDYLRGGGIYAFNSTLSLSNSTVSNNSAQIGGGISTFYSTLSLSNSTVSGNSSDGNGGGIYAYYYSITSLSNSTISGNSSGGAGGGIFTYHYSSLSLSDSTVSGNSASFDGGGISTVSYLPVTLNNSTVSGNSASFNGGGIYAYGPLNLTNSTVSNNSAQDGGGIYTLGSTVSLSNSTVSDNSATFNGGGIYTYYGSISLSNSTVSGNNATFDGGGIYAKYYSTATLNNSTVSGNNANTGGGIHAKYNSTVTLNNSTVSGNNANSGSGIRTSNNLTLNLSNSIIANNPGSSDCILGDPLSSNINNHFGDISCDGTADGDPLLSPLQNNGGPTLTHLPLTGSPVIDVGDNAAAAGLSTDQRGFARIVNTTVDIGAVEVAPGQIEFSLAAASVAENGGNATLLVQRTGGSEGVVGISFDSSNTTAIAGLDYTAVSNTLSWADGDIADKTINIPIIDDSLDENDETFAVALSAPTGGATLGALNNASVTITDNDLPPGLSIDDVNIVEGNTGSSTAVFSVSLSAASGKTIVVDFASSDGSAS
ncbi:MAG: hypothetical protein IMF09_04875, partial [Proteobacteria bacterium]|nr:hypothetical protein [Pseudomonadota bacterium]